MTSLAAGAEARAERFAVQRPHVAAVYITLAAGGLIGTGIWALVETHIAGGLFCFPHQDTDAVLHFATSTIWLTGAAHYYRNRTRSGSRLSQAAG